MNKYEPIPQWMIKNKKIIGIKELYKVETIESDYWIKKEGHASYMVYEPELKQILLKCDSINDAIEFIREITTINEHITNCIRGACIPL